MGQGGEGALGRTEGAEEEGEEEEKGVEGEEGHRVVGVRGFRHGLWCGLSLRKRDPMTLRYGDLARTGGPPVPGLSQLCDHAALMRGAL